MYNGGHLRWATNIEIVPKKKLTLDGHHCTCIVYDKYDNWSYINYFK